MKKEKGKGIMTEEPQEITMEDVKYPSNDRLTEPSNFVDFLLEGYELLKKNNPKFTKL